jgi:hypothetical protein
MLAAPIYVAGKFIENFCREGKWLGCLAFVIPWSLVIGWAIAWMVNHVQVTIR